MRLISKFLLPLQCAIAAAAITACTADSVKARQKKLTELSTEHQKVRQTRNEARQERTDAWFDRAMGKPVGDPQGGIRMPDSRP